MSGAAQDVIVHVSTQAGLFPCGTQLWWLPFTGGQVTLKHGSATQKPAVHFLPSGHGNSPGPHGYAHWQLVQVAPPGHCAPSSTWPLQLSSVQLQVSTPIGSPTQTTWPLTHSSSPLQTVPVPHEPAPVKSSSNMP